MFLIYHIKEKEAEKKKVRHTKKEILFPEINPGL
jgi:hypothetical protein